MKRFIAVLFAAALAFAFAPATPISAQETSRVYVVHAIDIGGGIGGNAVTVCVDGDKALTGFETGDVSEPLEIPGGSYDIAVILGADEDCADAAVIEQTVGVAPGIDLSLVAYYDVDDEAFALVEMLNPVECYPAGQGRVTARHLANAPPVDVRAGTAVVAGDLANGQQATLTVPASDYDDVNIALAGTDDVVFELGTVTVEEGKALIVNVIGGTDSDLSYFVQELELDPCPEPIVDPTPTTPAPQPQPQQATPRVTG
jgi:hypothetical protein